MTAWNAELYDAKHHFVTALGAGVLEMLAARPGERVLDLGCGTGDHVARLRADGVDAIGVDASTDMLARATERFPELPVHPGDARDLPYVAEFDAVLSNATLHWVPDAEAAARSVHRALRKGGRFAAEFGGAGNIATIAGAVATLRAEWRLPPAQELWYFPTIGEYATLLERVGFAVDQAELFDRPTRLDGDDGLPNWVRMFGKHLIDGVPDEDRFLDELRDRSRDELYRDGEWFADYRRIRVLAHA